MQTQNMEATFTKPPFEVFEDHWDDPSTLWGLMVTAAGKSACAEIVIPSGELCQQQEP